jgi:hypothetical protein
MPGLRSLLSFGVPHNESRLIKGARRLDFSDIDYSLKKGGPYETDEGRFLPGNSADRFFSCRPCGAKYRTEREPLGALQSFPGGFITTLDSTVVLGAKELGTGIVVDVEVALNLDSRPSGWECS